MTERDFIEIKRWINPKAYQTEFERLGDAFVQGQYIRRETDGSHTTITSYMAGFDPHNPAEAKIPRAFLIAAAGSGQRPAFSPLVFTENDGFMFTHFGFMGQTASMPDIPDQETYPQTHRAELIKLASSFAQEHTIWQTSNDLGRPATVYTRTIDPGNRDDIALVVQFQMRAAAAGIHEIAAPRAGRTADGYHIRTQFAYEGTPLDVSGPWPGPGPGAPSRAR